MRKEDFNPRNYILKNIPSKSLFQYYCDHHKLDSINDGQVVIVMPKATSWNPFPEEEYESSYSFAEIKSEIENRQNDVSEGHFFM